MRCYFKSFLFGLGILLLIMNSLPTLGQEQSVLVQNTNTVNIRSGPSTDNTQVGQLPWPAVQVYATGLNPDRNWVQITYNGLTGWVMRKYVTEVQGNINSLPIIGQPTSPNPGIRDNECQPGGILEGRCLNESYWVPGYYLHLLITGQITCDQFPQLNRWILPGVGMCIPPTAIPPTPVPPKEPPTVEQSPPQPEPLGPELPPPPRFCAGENKISTWTVEVPGVSQVWEFFTDNKVKIPYGANIYVDSCGAAEIIDLLAKGAGASATCVVGGWLGIDQLSGLQSLLGIGSSGMQILCEAVFAYLAIHIGEIIAFADSGSGGFIIQIPFTVLVTLGLTDLAFPGVPFVGISIKSQ